MPDRESGGAAIIGMAAVFPGAPDLATYWSNIERGVDAISLAPADRYDPVFFDPTSTEPDRLYCRRGGFLAPLRFDALGFGIMPVAVRGAEPDQLLALEVAARALSDAGYAERSFARDRAEVILGRGGYLTPGVARFDQRVRSVEQVTAALRAVVPSLTEADLEAVRADLREQMGPFGADTAIGLVPNLAASRIANRLDLHGGAYTIDAACASALVAVHQGVRDLESGECDLVIAGGVHLCHDTTLWSVFCQLGALSRSERIRPFDRRADGLLIGEGIGIVVLKRLADAERDDDRIYAVIRGTGMSSDGREASVMNPGLDGQQLALRRAWDTARIDRTTIGLVEAHGTGTPTGDAAELTTLARFFGAAPTNGARAGLGSVKSMIGHTMPAAGAAGLIKAALAVHHGVLPPTLHADEPHAGLDATRFRLIAKAEPWQTNDGARRAAVNAFGFGGINAHVVLEAHASSRSRRVLGSREQASDDLAESALLLSATSAALLLEALDASPSDRFAKGPFRLALFRPSPERRKKARAIIERGEAWRGRDDIWFSPNGLIHRGGRIAFLFPGIDATFEPHVGDVARHFDLPLRLPRGMSELTPGLGSLKETGMGIIAVGRLLHDALRALEVRADVIAGHSIGEWSGMIASGLIPEEMVDAVVESLVPESVEVPGVVFVAAGCGLDKAREAIAGLDSLVVSHDNCPHQVILCGHEADADVALDRLRRAGVLAQKLPFRSGYHSPIFADYVAPHRRILEGVPLVPPRVPFWSATTCSPYPSDAERVRQLAVEHLVRPVRFRELTLALYEQGVRVFVQLGTGSLSGFVDDTLRGQPHLAMAANVPARTGLAQLRRLAAALFVEGADLALERVGLHVSNVERAVTSQPSHHRTVELPLGVPLLRPRAGLVQVASPSGEARHDDDYEIGSDEPVAAEFAAGLLELAAARDDVISAWQNAGTSPSEDEWGPREMVCMLDLSLESFPELVDHAFYRQADGFGDSSDRYPVAPMTMLLELMMNAARELVPELVPIGLESVRAFRWLSVSPPVEVELRARFDGESRVEVTLAGYASGIVELANEYPEAPRLDDESLGRETPAPVSPADLYADRWMFHGEGYQGVTTLGPLGERGIRGVVAALPARGALLDNAGQLLGYWVMQHADVDRVAMPVMISRCTFFAPHPRDGELLDCTVRVRDFGPVDVRADVELSQQGRVWARIEGWQDKRFDADERVWALFRYPERNVLTIPRDGYGVLTKPWRSIAARDLLVRRYLDARERDEFEAVGPRGQRDWLLARIAVKDSVRSTLWANGHGALFPAEIAVHDEAGMLVARGPFAGQFVASVAHDGELTIVSATKGDARVGIAIAPIGVEAARLSAEELALLSEGSDRSVSSARLAVAKAALAKRLRRDEKPFAVRAVEGQRIRIDAEGDSAWVETRVEGAHVVGWSVA